MLDPHSLFVQYGGQSHNGYPTIHTPVQHTPAGTPYLTSPGVVMLSRPQTNLAGLQGFLAGYDESSHFSEYLDDPTTLPDSAQLCKVAGQLCYMSFGRRRSMNADAEKYFTNLKASGHGSVTEHANFSFLLYGVSRSVTHELVRHRAGVAISQQSQRYVSGRVLRFVERSEYASDKELHEMFLDRIDKIAYSHAKLVESLERKQAGIEIMYAEAKTDIRKKVQQTARSVLPNETEAPIVVTANVRAWRHILEMRASSHAETEIRALAVHIFLCLYESDPLLFGDYRLETLPDGTHEVRTDFEKV